MSATDELRRMLDERGAEWSAPNSCLRDEVTMWTACGFDYEAFEVPEPEGTFLLTGAHQDDLTPAQAVEATLGRGTCEMEPLDAFFTTVNQLDQTVWGVCSNCGTASPVDATYCCECGRKVER